MRVLPLILLVLPACYVGPKYKFKKARAACESDMVERANDLAIKVDQGPGDGTFDYDVSSWILLEHTTGDYDLETGAFNWENVYAPSAMRARETASGVGFIDRNGDMDLGYTLTATYKDASITQHEVRHLRTGCNETLRTENVDDENDVELIDATWANGALSWERNFVEGPVTVVGEGKMAADRSWAEAVGFSAGGLRVNWFTEGDGNGHRTRTFDDNDGFDKTEGSWERWYDGTVAMLFTRNNSSTKKQTWDFRVEADGTGVGTWEVAEESCQLSFKNFRCRLKNCTDPSSEGTCEVPVTWPVF